MIILSTLVIIAIGVAMFYSPSGDNGPQITPKDRYIIQIDCFLSLGKYKEAYRMLSSPKYPREELPWNKWKETIKERIVFAKKDLNEVEDLENLLES